MNHFRQVQGSSHKDPNEIICYKRRFVSALTEIVANRNQIYHRRCKQWSPISYKSQHFISTLLQKMWEHHRFVQDVWSCISITHSKAKRTRIQLGIISKRVLFLRKKPMCDVSAVFASFRQGYRVMNGRNWFEDEARWRKKLSRIANLVQKLKRWSLISCSFY